VRIRTGIRHQIRAHLAAVGHPVAGDAAYGACTDAGGFPFLHAWRLALCHPGTGAAWECRCPLPADRLALLAQAGLGGDWTKG
jgi:23S rRNA pseudouridine1911/1915/1917 synthase